MQNYHSYLILIADRRYSDTSLERISRDQVILCLRMKMPYDTVFTSVQFSVTP